MLVWLWLLISSASVCSAQYDVVVYGATSTGIMSALGAANASNSSHLKIALVAVGGAPIGGMTTGGLADIDTGPRTICGGFSREFFLRVGEVYTGKRVFMPKGQECKVSQQVYNQMLAEVSSQVSILHVGWELAVKHSISDNRTISALVLQDEATSRTIEVSGKVFIDASYEGDLLRLSGASWTVGREANTTYNERHAGVQAWPFPGSDPGQIFPPDENYTVDPYVRGSTKLLPGVNGIGLAQAGSADGKIMSYNFRVCLTDNVTNRVPIKMPPGYTRAQFELLARYLAISPEKHALHIEECPGRHRQPGCGMFIMRSMNLPPPADTRKLDLNTLGPYSSNMIGSSWAWPTANGTERQQLWQAHREYDQGLLFFLSTDEAVPTPMREEMSKYGLCKDEFVSSDHWPPQLYVRESVRMVNDYVLREGDEHAELSVLRGVAPKNSSIGLGNWGIDVHQVQRVALRDPRDQSKWRTVDEGDLECPGGEFEIPYESVVPRKSEVANLLVPTCLAASHLAYGAYRLESPYMVIGHSVGVAAALALSDGADVQDVNITQLQMRLRDQGQILTLAEQIPAPGEPPHPPGTRLPPVVTGPCASKSALATLNETVQGGAELLLLGANSLCASVLGYSVSNGAKVVGAKCHPDDRLPHHQNQEWVVDHQLICLRMQNAVSSGIFKCKRSCLVRDAANVVLGDCSDSNSAWEIDRLSKQIRIAQWSEQSACMQVSQSSAHF